MFSYDVARHRIAILKDAAGIGDGRLEHQLERGILRIFVITSSTPCSDCGAMIDENMKVVIHEKDAIWQYGRRVEEDGRSWAVARVGEENRLNHAGALADVFAKQNMTIVGGFIGRVVEHLE